MEIGITTIRRLMKSVTQKSITTDAIYKVGTTIEELITERTKKAEELLTERNKLRKEQGLREKQRIDEELIKTALES